jgi:ubiquinone/menaquinone biosynthesis C-methylase UbiE
MYRTQLSLALVLLSCAGLAQSPGRHPVSGRVYAGVMGMNGAPWLVRAERIEEEEPDKAIAALDLKPGMTIADIGAGVGYMSFKMAKKIGSGKVYAVDIQPPMIEKLKENAIKEKITNVEPILGETADPKLPAASIDLAIMVDVYHELSEPQKMLANIRTALKANGRLVLLEYRAEDPNVPINPSHKMTVAQAKQELEAEGYVLSKTIETLPRQHILILTLADSMKRVQ